jgi:hypothetical protein
MNQRLPIKIIRGSEKRQKDTSVHFLPCFAAAVSTLYITSWGRLRKTAIRKLETIKTRRIFFPAPFGVSPRKGLTLMFLRLKQGGHAALRTEIKVLEKGLAS